MESGVDTTTRVGPGWIESKVEETSHDETDDERMSRGRRGIRLSRPTGRPVAVESVEEERVPERVKGSRPSSMVCHDLMGRVMSRVVGTLLARSTLLTSVAAALVLLFCCCRCTRNRPGDLRPRPHQRAEAVSNRPSYWIFTTTTWKIQRFSRVENSKGGIFTRNISRFSSIVPFFSFFFRLFAEKF